MIETSEVKYLRDLYGLHDSRNQYTKEQILEKVDKKLYYISVFRTVDGKGLQIEYKLIPGYVSEDGCIFIKDKQVTNYDCYMPMKKISRCTQIKEGIWHAEIDDVVYCTTDELPFCIEYYKNYIKNKLEEDISELEDKIKLLKEMTISSTEMMS